MLLFSKLEDEPMNKACWEGTIASSLTCVQLHKRAEKIAAMLAERGHLQDGDHVALVYPPGIDLIVAFYGCLYAGCVPITVRPPHLQNIATTLPTVKMIVEFWSLVSVFLTLRQLTVGWLPQSLPENYKLSSTCSKMVDQVVVKIV
ncbi:hypothetical protein INR49_005222 [Caranx melampygus]|nr:hypothetical protein INR49_005222 [Caranx melampygus]